MALDLFQYQEEGARWLASRERAGLHDEMGVGKTATVIRAAEYIGARRGIIVGPALLRENWLAEFRKFGRQELRVVKGRTIHDLVAWLRGRYDVLVTSYELATKWTPEILAAGEYPDFVAFDEAHFLKNVNAKRTAALLGKEADEVECLLERACYAWHVTGTPVPNDPLDVFTFLRFSRAMPLSLASFTRRYFKARSSAFGTRTTALPEMLDELRALIENNRIRRLQKDVYPQLPPVLITTAVVDGDAQPVRDLLAQYPGLERAIVNAVSQGGLSFLDAQHVGTLRRLIGEAKAVPYAHQLAEELRYTGGKRAVYGIHVSALQTVRDVLARAGVGVVLVNGTTSERERVAAVEHFQTDPQCQCFVGNIRTAGAGITLTAACDLDLLESDWTPAMNAQAIKRVHRVGQTRNVRARFVTLADSFDQVVTEVVAEKTRAIAAVEGDTMVAAPL